jgi:hypothetical protein
VVFSYFDPEAGRYRTLRSDPTRVRASGEAGPAAVSTTGEGMPVGDIAGLMAASGAALQGVQWHTVSAPPLYRQPWAYGALALPLLLAAGLVAYRRRTDGEAEAGADAGTNPGASDRTAVSGSSPPSPTGDAPAVDLDPGRHEEAMQTAQTHLQEAHHHLRDDAVKPFYREVEQAVLGFIGAQLDLPVPGMVRSTLDDHLTRREVPPDLRASLYELLDACDQAQYTPATPSHDSMRAALSRAEELVLEFDDHLE